jgi:proline iminopeptidase
MLLTVIKPFVALGLFGGVIIWFILWLTPWLIYGSYGILTRRKLYQMPPPFLSGFMNTGDEKHKLAWEVIGSALGKWVIVFHGGPGRGYLPYPIWQCFDPSRWRILNFDQRGAGESQPPGSLDDNSTDRLLMDIEQLRITLGIEKWTVFGSGWGAYLALRYAKEHAKHISEIILTHPLLFRHEDIAWIFQPKIGLSQHFPKEFAEFVSPIPDQGKDNFLSAYYKQLLKRNNAAVKAWVRWEAIVSGVPVPDLTTPDEASKEGRELTEIENEAFEQAWKLALIECHYFLNRAFLPDGEELLDGLEEIRQLQIPGFVIRGAWDFVTPESVFYALSKAWPEAELITLECTHSNQDPLFQRTLLGLTSDIVGCGCYFKWPGKYKKAGTQHKKK